MDRRERRRHKRLQTKAASIVQTMPVLPSSYDDPHARTQKVVQWRAWTEQARRQVGGDAELSTRVMELLRDRMGFSHPDPVRAAENARELLAAGMGDVGLSNRAAAVLDRNDHDHSAVAVYLIEQYVRVWTEHGTEMPVGVEIGGALLVIGQRDALRINVWVADEPGTLPVVRTIRERDL